MKAATVALALSLASNAAAVPFTKPKIGTTQVIRVPALRNPNAVRNGPAALRKAYVKYGLSVPSFLEDIHLKKRQATVGASPQTDESEWLCPVTVGKTEMHLDFDTGSADLWVFSDELSNVGSHASYPCKARAGGGGGPSPPSSGGGLQCIIGCVASAKDFESGLECVIGCFAGGLGGGIPGISGGDGGDDGDDGEDDGNISDPFSDIQQVKHLSQSKKDMLSKILKVTGVSTKSLKTLANDPPKGSSDNRFAGYTWSIQYGDQSSASGNVVNDTVTVGGVSLPDHAVECANKASAEFIQSPNDGLLGLSFGAISTVMNGKTKAPQPTWFEDAVAKKVIPKGVFVADLKHKEEGSYLFGGLPKGIQEEAVTWVPIQSETGFWQYTSNGGINVNGKNYLDQAKNGAIADTGTTLLLMGNSSAAGYYSHVTGAVDDKTEGGWVFPCTAKLPDLEVSIGDKWVKIPGNLINFAETKPGSGKCFGGLQSLEDELGWQAATIPYIMGDIMLKAIQAIFDKDNLRFGWVAKEVKA